MLINPKDSIMVDHRKEQIEDCKSTDRDTNFSEGGCDDIECEVCMLAKTNFTQYLISKGYDEDLC